MTVETAIEQWKQVIGDGLCLRIDERRVTEVKVAVYVLNLIHAPRWHRSFLQAKDPGTSDTIHNFDKWLERQREAE